jgi:hypothetical protein
MAGFTYPWVDPRSVDWTDALNPLTKPGWSKQNNRYAFDSLQEPLSVALRDAIGIEPRIWVCPDPASQLLAGNNQSVFNVPAEPNTWIWAINAASNPGSMADPAGFAVQISDSQTGASLFSSPIRQTLLDGTLQTSGNANQNPLIVLPLPRLFVPPSYPVVKIVNFSSSAQICIVQLFCAIETDTVQQ